jgi:dTDP-4-amino-4,6-dideoxygalactose transaminase
MNIRLARGCLGEEELAEVRAVFEYGYFGLGSKVDDFERALEDYFLGRHVVAVNSGTNALHLVLDSIDIKVGDEVIVPSLTFIATHQAISATGAKPVPCDVYPGTLLMNMEDVKRKITPLTKAIVPVHYGGSPCDMDALLLLKKTHGLRIVEDAAHAFGSCYKGQKIGSFGDITCFSFGSLKNISCGEGGAVVFADEELNGLLRKKRNLGMDRKSQSTTTWKERSWLYDVPVQGFRYHMSNINAAIGLAQLKKFESFISRRRRISEIYQEGLKDLTRIRLLNVDFDTIVPHLFVIRVLDGYRDSMMEFLMENGIETGINYIPTHFHSFYKTEALSLPETEQAFEEILSLPFHCALTDEDILRVIRIIFNFYDNCSPSPQSESITLNT